MDIERTRTKSCCLGIWLGFPSQIPSLINEGVGRYVFNLAKVIIRDHAVNCEVWCYHVNVRVVRESLRELLEQSPAQIKICTELDPPRFAGARRGALASLRSAGLSVAAAGLASARGGLFALKKIALKLKVPLRPRAWGPRSGGSSGDDGKFTSRLPSLFVSLIIDIWETFNKTANLLAALANRHSQADVFLVPLVTIYSGLGLRKKLIVSLHDLFILEYFEKFKEQRPARVRQIRRVERTGREFAEKGAFFVSNSDSIRRNHVLRFLKPPEARTGFIYLPAIVPERIEAKVAPEAALRKEFGIAGPYLFYPSQVRVYKNLLVLLQALKILRDRGQAISLVLTGNLKGDSRSYRFYLENHLQNHIIFTKTVADEDLFGLYKYAAAAVVPTLSEGGFPFQGLEAMSMNTPAIMTDLPVIRERLLFHGLDPDRSGLMLFSPHDAGRLASFVEEVVRDRQRASAAQRNAKEKLFSYTWDDTGRQYFDLVCRVGRES